MDFNLEVNSLRLNEFLFRHLLNSEHPSQTTLTYAKDERTRDLNKTLRV